MLLNSRSVLPVFRFLKCMHKNDKMSCNHLNGHTEFNHNFFTTLRACSTFDIYRFINQVAPAYNSEMKSISFILFEKMHNFPSQMDGNLTGNSPSFVCLSVCFLLSFFYIFFASFFSNICYFTLVCLHSPKQ